VNKGLAKLAGEVCDGFQVHPFHSVRYLREVILPAIQEGAEKKRREMKDITVSVTAFVATDSEEENFARTQLAFYASTPSYRTVMDLHGWRTAAEKLSALAVRGEWAEMPRLVTDEMLNEFCLMTNEASFISALKDKYIGIANRLTLYNPFVPGERDELWKKLIH
jgi:alkanesulfonate monooxygenase SsuD/methylene tetrahydromethanopterin reductase-like flavin-dependent oxidoreductase (luciferase family)